MSVTTRDDTADRITKTEEVLGGQPRVAGTRISVLHIVDLVLHDKYTVDDVAYDIYPELSIDDVEAALVHYLLNRSEMHIWERRRREETGAISGPEEMPFSPNEE